MLELGSQPDSKHEASRLAATKGISLKRIEVQDRRLAAIHEAAHHIIACHRGMQEVDSWIRRVDDPTLYDESWVGHCRWRNPSPGSNRYDTMIGVAGMVAANLWKAGNDPERMDDIFDLLDDPNCMSESDWCHAGLDCGAVLTETQWREIEAVIDLLCGPLRLALLGQARKLIIESRDSYTVEPIETRRNIAPADWSA
jgi:hypothetical protein